MDNISEENNDNFELFRVLSKGNPGACSVLMELIENVDNKILDNFLYKILDKEILGSRLWYIYKNECNRNINELINKDLTLFTDDYFYEKFEKYIVNKPHSQL